MSKYILEMEDKPNFHEDGTNFYKCVTVPWWSISENTLKRLDRYDPDEKANADYDAGYAEGLNAAWEAAKTAYHMAGDKRERYIGYHWMGDVFNELTPAQVIEGVSKYKEAQEAEQEFKVGDEVEESLGKTTIISVVWYVSDERIFGMTNDGKWNACYKSDARKTGRHFPQIAEVLEQMKGE